MYKKYKFGNQMNKIRKNNSKDKNWRKTLIQTYKSKEIIFLKLFKKICFRLFICLRLYPMLVSIIVVIKLVNQKLIE